MKLSGSSHEKLQQFFRVHFGDDSFTLPKIRFYSGKATNFVTRRFRIDGITFGRRVYIQPERIRKEGPKKLRISGALAVHEIAHVLQYRRDGFIRFLVKYLTNYRRNLKDSATKDENARLQAYLDIGYEIEARRAASEYVRWSAERKFRKEPSVSR